jgi:hypothetical protein
MKYGSSGYNRSYRLRRHRVERVPKPTQLLAGRLVLPVGWGTLAGFVAVEDEHQDNSN